MGRRDPSSSSWRASRSTRRSIWQTWRTKYHCGPRPSMEKPFSHFNRTLPQRVGPEWHRSGASKIFQTFGTSFPGHHQALISLSWTSQSDLFLKAGLVSPSHNLTSLKAALCKSGTKSARKRCVPPTDKSRDTLRLYFVRTADILNICDQIDSYDLPRHLCVIL